MTAQANSNSTSAISAPQVTTYHATADIDVITANFPIPGFGVVPINAFVIKGAEPILVDTCAGVLRDQFMKALKTVIDPSELKWIWLTHTDFDHIGSLHELLEINPRVRVITSFLSVGILSLAAPLPLDRVYLAADGDKIGLADRSLAAFRPPSFDNPATLGFYDSKTGVMFSSDCFGALLASPPQNAADLSESDLRAGQTLWATLDAPWLHKTDDNAVARDLSRVREMNPAMILSSHLPAAGGYLTERLLQTLAGVKASTPFLSPNQAMLEQMLKGMAGGAAR